MFTSYQSDWTLAAKCIGTEDILFAEGSEQKSVRVFCQNCPVKRECLAEALDARMEWGIWGGMTERERRTLLRRRPDVTSWREVLFASDSAVAGSAQTPAETSTRAAAPAGRTPVRAGGSPR